MTSRPRTEAGRALLADNFAIGDWTDPRTRVADDLTAPQFVDAILAIESELLDQAIAGVKGLLHRTFDGSEGEGWRLVLMSEDGGVMPGPLSDEFVAAFTDALLDILREDVPNA